MTLRPNRDRDQDQAFLGTQEELVFDSVPVGAEVVLNQQLRGSTITVAGVYGIQASLGGINQFDLSLVTTIGAGSATILVRSQYKDGTARTTFFTGAIAATNFLTAQATRGEKVLYITITLAAASSLTFTRAELLGSATVIATSTAVVQPTAANLNATVVGAITAAVLAALSATGAVLVSLPGDWALAAAPTAGVAASVTRAAGAAGVRHVCTGASVTFSTGATAQTAVLQIAIRDGASGGAALFIKQVILPVNAVWEFNLTGLNIVGSAATAMTIETGTPVAGAFVAVLLTGHDVT